MGVQGFDLLKIAVSQKTLALMLTAHALNEENIKKPFEEGTAYFAPKEKMVDKEDFVADVFEPNSSPGPSTSKATINRRNTFL